VEVVPEGKTARVVNYGNGACDGSFTVKIGSRTITVNR
jgi:hypothetical protein